MIVEGYDPGSEEPREIDPRRRLENILIFTGVIILLVVLFIIGNRDYQLPVECYEEAAEIVIDPGMSIRSKVDLVLSTEQELIHQDDLIILVIENTSEYSVWFPPGFNLEIFEIVSGSNIVGRRILSAAGLNHDKVLGPAQSGNHAFEFVIRPDIKVFDETTEILVSVWGYRYQDERICKERHSGSILITLHSNQFKQARFFTLIN
jgi:hypothetical protein